MVSRGEALLHYSLLLLGSCFRSQVRWILYSWCGYSVKGPGRDSEFETIFEYRELWSNWTG